MLESLVGWCLRRPWMVVIVTLALTAGGVYLTATRFAIDTDTAHLFSPRVAWRANEARLDKSFPALQDLIVAVGGAYGRYCGVTADMVERLLGAPSMGRFFNQNLKREAVSGRYDCPT